jgi:hypothetical protein
MPILKKNMESDESKNQAMTDKRSEILEKLVELPCNKSIMSIVRRIVVAACVCYICNERNTRMFANERRDSQELMTMITNSVRMKTELYRVRLVGGKHPCFSQNVLWKTRKTEITFK